MAIIQQPSSLSLLGNLSSFEIAGSSPVNFTLKDGNTTLASEVYQPSPAGNIIIDVRQLIEGRLTFSVKTDNLYEQTGIAKTFTAVIDGQTITFKVLRAGVANLADTVNNFLKGNFLTWQPTSKEVSYSSPEWLTYYAVEAGTLKLKAYFDDGTSTTYTIGTLTAGKAYTANMQYSHRAGIMGKYPTHYDVWVESTAGTPLTYTQRYLYSLSKSELEQWVLFENSLGGIDTVRTSGATELSGDHTYNTSTVDGVSTEFRIDTHRNYTQHTGALDTYERRWLLDLFPARKKYVHHAGAIRPIVLTADTSKYSTDDLPSSYSFTFRFADDSRGLLNLIRNAADIPAEITLPNLSAPNFSIPPRLSEFPRVPLSEGVILPAFDPNSDTPTVTTIGQIIAAAVAEALLQIPGGDGTPGTGGQLVNIVRKDSLSSGTDDDVFSSLRTKKEIDTAIQAFADDIDNYLDTLDEKFLSKVNPDTAQGFIEFLKGISVEELATLTQGLEVGSFTTGALGSGAALKMVDGTSYAEVDNLIVRQKATFRELIIESLKHIGGQLVLTPARMKCVRVVEEDTFYKCYFDTGDGEVTNEFVAGDFARCQVFTGSGTKFYWRLVTLVGEDWINLSKTSAAVGSDAPEAGDDIAQLGNATDPTRQNAQILSTVGVDAPSWKQYKGINSFSLEGKDTTVFSGNGNKIDGKTVFKSDGKNLEEALDDVEERVLGLRIGGVNLLRNTGFLGDFNSLNLNSSALLTVSTAIDTNPLIHWVHSNVNVIDAPSKSGKGIHLGSLQQNTPVLEVGETYIVSFKAKGANLNIGLVNTVEVTLAVEYQLFEYKMIPTETKSYVFSMTGDADAYEIQLEKATIRSDYNYSIEDDLKTISQLQAINTITATIKEADTSILGGLILTSMLQLGKYKDGVMEKVTSGINGIYNNDDDPAIWAGGSFDDAIRTVQRLIDNPNYEPSEAEWAEMANIVMTHGGDGFFKGYIYALGGLFRGRVETNIDGNRIIIDPQKRELRMINQVGRPVLIADFNVDPSNPVNNFSQMRLNRHNADGVIIQQINITPSEIGIEFDDPDLSLKGSASFGAYYMGMVMQEENTHNNLYTTKASFHASYDGANGNLSLTTTGLPTSSTGLSTGRIYSDNGTIKVKI